MPQPDIYQPDYVAGLFDRMSRTYGVANYLTSFGFTERWRKQCVGEIDWSAGPLVGYDLMSGMGEIWESVITRAQHGTVIRGVDISPGMNARAAQQQRRFADWDITVVQADALRSGLADESADFIVSSFGLKTFSKPQLERLAQETARLLRPNGQCSFVEIARPNGWLSGLFMFYLKLIVPLIGRWFMRDAASYRMLGIYTERHGDAGHFARALKNVGLAVEHQRLFFGCACLVRGIKQ